MQIATLMRLTRSYFAITFLLTSSIAEAGGLVGDTLSAAGNLVAPGSNIGKPIDDLNRQLKQAAPLYGTIEQGASQTIQNTTREFLVDTAGPVLFGLIQASENDALRGGVQEVPPYVQNIMARFYGFNATAGVRFRVGQGGDLALASNAFRYGDAVAITLDDIIVFRDDATAHNLATWAHELTHVQQVRRSGLLDFAKRYVWDSASMEGEAYNNQHRFDQWYQTSFSMGVSGERPIQSYLPSRAISMPSVQRPSNVCATPRGVCVIPAFGRAGLACYCGSAFGPINGNLAPVN